MSPERDIGFTRAVDNASHDKASHGCVSISGWPLVTRHSKRCQDLRKSGSTFLEEDDHYTGSKRPINELGQWIFRA